MVAEESLGSADAGTTARVLASALGREGFDLVVCGEGSSDRYAQQVGAQVAARLGVPYVNAVSAVSAGSGVVVVQRTLEDEVETLEVTLPAVISMTSDAYTPRIPSMKDILGAGKKPIVEWSLADLDEAVPESTSLRSWLAKAAGVSRVGPERAPEAVPRAKVMYEAGQAGEFFSAVRQLMGKGAK